MVGFWTRRNFTNGTVACASLLGLGELDLSKGLQVASKNSAGRTVAGSKVHVSKAYEELPHNAVILAADPSAPRQLLAGSMITYAKDGKGRHHPLAY